MNSHYMLVFACLWELAQSHPSTGNLAATIRATQSSIANYLGYAGNAIDGNNNTDYSMGSCSRTANEESPWWRVDMFYRYQVKRVRITTSSDGPGLTGAEIRIGENINNSPLCANIESLPAGQAAEFTCERGKVPGRYLTIIVPDYKTNLTLCEVEVFGFHDPLEAEDGHSSLISD
uniref:fucolectin-5-like n=1 Tax=Pristiophorus japonicus TaxID=55135 RepID=UPI00398ED6D7